MGLAYKFFFCGVPDNQHLSTPWRAYGGPLGVSRETAGTRRVGLHRLGHMFFPRSPGSPGLGRARGLLMRLLGSDLACFRGGRQVFSGLSFAVEAAEALPVLGPTCR